MSRVLEAIFSLLTRTPSQLSQSQHPARDHSPLGVTTVPAAALATSYSPSPSRSPDHALSRERWHIGIERVISCLPSQLPQLRVCTCSQIYPVYRGRLFVHHWQEIDPLIRRANETVFEIGSAQFLCGYGAQIRAVDGDAVFSGAFVYGTGNQRSITADAQ